MKWDYTTAESLVLNYKNNIPGASDELIANFHKFLNKFSRIINDNVIDLSNRCTRGFINLYMLRTSIFKGQMHKVSHSRVGMDLAGQAVGMLHTIFTSKYERDEIDNIIAMTLLECARSYRVLEEGQPMFHIYVLKCYHFRLYHNLMVVIKDSLNLAMLEVNYNSIHGNHKETAVEDDYNLNSYNRILDRIYTEDDIEVDDNWIVGITANLFSEYTTLERKIIKLKFVDGYTDEEIADVLSVSRKTVNERKLVLLKKIEVDARALGFLKE